MKLLKKIFPRSLYARFLLIIILPTVLVQLVAVYIFYDRHWSSMSRNMTASLVGEISMVVNLLEESSKDARNDFLLNVMSHMNLAIEYEENKQLPQIKMVEEDEYALLIIELAKHIKKEFVVDYDQNIKEILVYIQMGKDVLTISTSQKRLANPTTYIFILWMTGSAVLLMIVAILFLRGQIRSIINLTEAAEKFGKGQDTPTFKPSGAKEVRLASIAFIEMKERIKRLLTRRTQMLAGVSHDLRTPLTRMKLQLAMMDQENPATIEMQADVVEMEHMLEGYLDFVRGESKEPTQNIILKDFIGDILRKYSKDQGRVEANIAEDISVHIKPHAFKRAINNLISNGLRYSSFVCISAYRYDNEKLIYIFIDDNGPGIAEEERKKVFQPFYRLEKSRNTETGGIGLGLSIARDIVHRHGGEITLDEATMGGLRVIITLPL